MRYYEPDIPKFHNGNRVSIRKEYRHRFGVYEGRVMSVVVGNSTRYSGISYWVLLDAAFKTCYLDEYILTYTDNYGDFLERIKDRIL